MQEEKKKEIENWCRNWSRLLLLFPQPPLGLCSSHSLNLKIPVMLSVPALHLYCVYLHQTSNFYLLAFFMVQHRPHFLQLLQIKLDSSLCLSSPLLSQYNLCNTLMYVLLFFLSSQLEPEFIIQHPIQRRYSIHIWRISELLPVLYWNHWTFFECLE